jgi:glutamate-1-semialdehyde 2,1-aminomutase
MNSRVKSEQLFAEALRYIPGGVNSPVRAFRAVGGQPFFVNRAEKAHIFDVDGNDYVDYVGTWGPAILGHAHPKIIAAIQKTAVNGTSFGIPNPLEVTMAKLICEAVPSVKKVRLCNSGTEATMSAIRLARGFTQRDKIIKFDGCYHGHADSLLVKAGSGALTFGYPDSAGVPAAFTQHTIVVPYNDEAAVRAAFAANAGQIAGIIVEPVPGNAGLYLPKSGYLEFLSTITAEHGALLIFDEVMTGFRLARGGAQEYFGVKADLVTYGKTLGGGLPVGALCGRKDLMKRFRDDRPSDICFARGTFNSHPHVMGAMHEFLDRIDRPEMRDLYAGLDAAWNARAEGVNARFAAEGLPVRVANLQSIWTVCYTQPSRYNWMFQYYLRAEGLALSWVGTGRLIFSLNYTDADFAEVEKRFVAAAGKMKADGWWWNGACLTNKNIRRQILKEMLARKFR